MDETERVHVLPAQIDVELQQAVTREQPGHILPGQFAAIPLHHEGQRTFAVFKGKTRPGESGRGAGHAAIVRQDLAADGRKSLAENDRPVSGRLDHRRSRRIVRFGILGIGCTGLCHRIFVRAGGLGQTRKPVGIDLGDAFKRIAVRGGSTIYHPPGDQRAGAKADRHQQSEHPDPQRLGLQPIGSEGFQAPPCPDQGNQGD